MIRIKKKKKNMIKCIQENGMKQIKKRKKNTVELTEKQKVNKLHIHHNFSNIL